MGFPLFLEKTLQTTELNYRSILIAALQTTGLFISGFLIPVIGQLLALFTPVPLIVLSIRNGRTDGAVALIASCAVIGLLGGWQSAAVLFLSFGLMAAALSEGLRRQWKPESAALLGALLPITAIGAALASYFARIGKNPIAVVEEYLKGSMEEAAKAYTQLGLTEMAAAISSIPDDFIHYLVRLLPGVIIATSVLQAAACYGVSKSIISRKPSIVPKDTMTFAHWHAPDIWIWGLIAALALILVPGDAAQFTGWNIALLYCLLYLVQGISVVDSYLRRVRVHSFVRGLIHALILMLPSIVLVIALGIVDIWADFRKVRLPMKETPDKEN